MAKINRCSPIKERVRRFGKRIDFLPFFPRRAAQGKNPRYGAEKKNFLFFLTEVCVWGEYFFSLKKRMRRAVEWENECTYFGLADSKNFS